jgi:hypothetical protein
LRANHSRLGLKTTEKSFSPKIKDFIELKMEQMLRMDFSLDLVNLPILTTMRQLFSGGDSPDEEEEKPQVGLCALIFCAWVNFGLCPRVCIFCSSI